MSLGLVVYPAQIRVLSKVPREGDISPWGNSLNVKAPNVFLITLSNDPGDFRPFTGSCTSNYS